MNSRTTKVGVVGTGMISDIYLKNMKEMFKNIEVVSCCAKHIEHAEEKAKQYGIKACTVEEMFSDPQIEIVVILTGIASHYDLIREALLHGKHVFTEKTMTVDLKQAKELIEIAERKGLYFCSAPETFLGAALQTAKKAIEERKIGDIYSFHISANRNLDCLASMAGYLRQPGGGLCQDYGVYYLTALCSLFGGVSKISAVSRNNQPIRINTYPRSQDYGQEFLYENESQTAAILSMRNGIVGTFSLNGDTNFVDLADFVVYGTNGVLKLGDANRFGGQITRIPMMYGIKKELETEVLTSVNPFYENSRGIGVAEMADSIQKGKKSRLDCHFAYHIFEIIEAIKCCGESGGCEEIQSACEVPDSFFVESEWQNMIN